MVGAYSAPLIDMEMEVAEWQCFFASLEQHSIVSLEDFEERRMNLMEGTEASGTPRAIKKARVSSVLASATLPTPEVMMDPEAFLPWLVRNWPEVDRRFASLKRSCTEISLGWRSATSDLDVLNAAVALIRAEIGDRDEDTQDLDIWTAIRTTRLMQGGAGMTGLSAQVRDVTERCSQSELCLMDNETRLGAMSQESKQDEDPVATVEGIGRGIHASHRTSKSLGRQVHHPRRIQLWRSAGSALGGLGVGQESRTAPIFDRN